MRILFAAILGAIAMFLWTFIAHMALPLAEAGIREIPNEQAVTAAMQANMGDQPGLFIFPGTGLGPEATKSSGLLMYHPPGQPFQFGKRLTIEFASELLATLLAVFLLAQAGPSTFGGRVCFVTTAGILAAVATNISYWNWYGFPTVYTAAYMCIQIVGFLCAGLVIALVLKKATLATS